MTTTDDAQAEAAPPTPPAPAGARRWSRGRITIGIGAVASLLAVLAVLATAGLVVARGDAKDWRARAEATEGLTGRREAALAAARTFAVSLTSYDYRRIAENVSTVTAGAGGKFAEEYKLASDQRFQQLVVANKAVATGEVKSAGVVSVNPAGTEVVVLLAVDQTVTNANTPKPRVDRNRIQITLTLTGDRWLATDVRVL